MNKKYLKINFVLLFLVGLVGAEVPEGQPALVTDLVHVGPRHVHSHEVPHVNQDTVQLKIIESGYSAAENNKKTGYSAADNNKQSGYSAAKNNKQ